MEHQRRILAIRGGRQHRTEYCGGHLAYYPKKDRKPGGQFDATCGQTWKHGIRCRLTRTCVGVRSQDEARGRPLAFWQRGSLVVYFPKMQTKMPPQCRSCVLANGQNIGTPLLLSRAERTSPCWNRLCARVRVWNHRHRHEWRVVAGSCACGACM